MPEARVRSPAGQALRLAVPFVLLKLALHIVTNLLQPVLGWGYFRDELYYLACGHHLAWGYVDHGPLVAVQARLAETLFSHSLVGLRLPAALAGSVRILLTGLLALRLGGRRFAQALGMLGVLLTPAYLGADSTLSMNSFDSLFWITCLLALLSIQPNPGHSTADAGSPARFSTRTLGLFVLFGSSAGLAILNKPTALVFLSSLCLALLLSCAGRTLLLRSEALAALSFVLALSAPYLLWQIHNSWPTLEFIHNGRAHHKDPILNPLQFFLFQVEGLLPLMTVLWLPGLVYLLRRREVAWLAWTFLLCLTTMIVLGAKPYYLYPIYPVLFAASGLAWERLTLRSRLLSRHRVALFTTTAVLLSANVLVVLPLTLPVLRPATWVRYSAAAGLFQAPVHSTSPTASPLPLSFADRFGWQEEADQITQIVASLSSRDRAGLAILTTNYGEAGALQLLAPSLPPVLCGQNNYYLWGFGNTTGNTLLAISGRTPEDLERFYTGVHRLGTLSSSPYAPLYERQRSIYLLEGPKQTMQLLWPNFKDYI